MSSNPRQSGSARSQPTKESSPWRWVAGAAAMVGSALFLRSLLRGTAPSATSAYVLHRNATQKAPEMPPMWRASAPEYRPPPGTMGAGGRRATFGSSQQNSHGTASSTYYQEHREAQYQETQRQQQRHAEEQREQQRWEDEYDDAHNDGSWLRMKKSDFAKYEAFAEAERAHYASQAAAAGAEGGDFTSLSASDRAFEIGREQARADFVQSKFMHLKRSKRILNYQSWTGARAAADSELDEAGWHADAEESNAGGSFRAIQRQMATQPRFVHARQLLFTPAGIPGGSESGLPAAPHVPFTSGPGGLGSAPLGPLTVNAVRTAYFSRAKLCHPDMGGNPEHFQRLTDAYDLLVGTLQPLEKQMQQRRAARKHQHQQHAQKPPDA